MCMYMPIASSSSTSSEGAESTDIDSEQAQRESVSILNVLGALMPADRLLVEGEKWQQCFDCYNICPLANRNNFWCKMKHKYLIGQNSIIITTVLVHKSTA